jgi:hypothetical protein
MVAVDSHFRDLQNKMVTLEVWEPRHNRLCRGNRVLKSLGLKPYSTAGRLGQSDAEEFNNHSLVCSTESGYKSKNPDLSSMRTTTFLIGKLDVFLTEPGPTRPGPYTSALVVRPC